MKNNNDHSNDKHGKPQKSDKNNGLDTERKAN